MIISVSRRTDIPAFFSEWFLNRVREGFVQVRNPINPRMVSQISLSQDVVDCLVFWTKNPEPLIPYLSELDKMGYKYYFQYTLTPYGKEIEPNVPSVEEAIQTFRRLSSIIGSDRILWRYDPVLLTENMSIDFHVQHFSHLSSQLKGSTNRCVMSFVDFYRKCQKQLARLEAREALMSEKANLLRRIQPLAQNCNIELETCAEDITTSDLNVKRSSCIDKELIERMWGCELKASKDKTQRAACGCIESIDIGSYNTCKHQCLYCYANTSSNVISDNVRLHSPKNTLLFGELGADDKVNMRKMKSLVRKQQDLW